MIRGIATNIVGALLLLALLTSPVQAQEVSETPFVPTEEATVVVEQPSEPEVEVTVIPIPDGGGVVVVDRNPLEDPEVQMSFVEFLTAVALSVISGVGLGLGVLAIIFKVLEDKRAQDFSEKLYQAQPPEQQERIHEIFNKMVESVDKVIAFVERATDGLPNETGPLTRRVPVPPPTQD